MKAQRTSAKGVQPVYRQVDPASSCRSCTGATGSGEENGAAGENSIEKHISLLYNQLNRRAEREISPRRRQTYLLTMKVAP